MTRPFAILGFLLSVANGLAADEPSRAFEPPRYDVKRADSPIVIDGRLDEPAWFAATPIGAFHFPWFKEGQREQTIVKLLWDDKCLYIAHICQDAHITARHTAHDDPVAEDDCFEVMLAADARRPARYVNIEWNLRGAYVDGFRPEGPQGPRPPWDAQGFRIVGSYVGSLNDQTDLDAYWIGEAVVPFESIANQFDRLPPKPGDEWRMNFNRHGGEVNAQYSQWSPVDSPTPSFHAPHRFGRVVFSSGTLPFLPWAREVAPPAKAP